MATERSSSNPSPASRATARSPSCWTTTTRSTRPGFTSSSSAASSASSRAGPTGRPRSWCSGSAASARSATTWRRPRPWTSSSASGPSKLTADGREDAPADALRPDVPVPRPALLPPRLARPPVRLRRRPGHPQRHRRRRCKHTDLAVQGVMMRKFGQEIIMATAGKKIHGTGAIPGGINKNLSPRGAGRASSRGRRRSTIDTMIEWAAGGPGALQGLHAKQQGPRRRLRRLPLEPPQPRPQGRRPGPLPRRPPGRRRRGQQDPRRRRLPGLPRLHRRRGAVLDLHEVPLSPVPRQGGRLVPGRAAGPAQHLRLHPVRRWPRRSSRLKASPTASPTTCPSTSTGPG